MFNAHRWLLIWCASFSQIIKLMSRHSLPNYKPSFRLGIRFKSSSPFQIKCSETYVFCGNLNVLLNVRHCWYYSLSFTVFLYNYTFIITRWIKWLIHFMNIWKVSNISFCYSEQRKPIVSKYKCDIANANEIIRQSIFILREYFRSDVKPTWIPNRHTYA